MARSREQHESADERAAMAMTRVDAAHMGPASSATPTRADFEAVAAPAAGQSLASEAAAIHQVRTQAAQLSVHLQRQQATIDHREAELNARLASMENEIRGARLWLNERHAELADKTAQLDQRERDLESRLSAIDASVAANQTPIKVSELELAERAAELDRREAELDQLAERLKQDHGSAAPAASGLRSMRAEGRIRRLEQADKTLAVSYADLERGRKLLADDRAAFERTRLADRERTAQEAAQAGALHAKARHELDRQTDELSARQEALERMRNEVARSQQEVLEMRLATEELWARLCGTMAPAALTQSLAQLRLRLADEHRLAREELARQKAEVHSLASEVAERHGRLVAERDELQNWFNRRQEEIEKQASAIVRAQRQVDEQEARLKEATAEWIRERFDLHAEIRRLLVELNRPGQPTSNAA
ncbi:MAG TPA: hypothetical protein VL175_10190 [Pirellulales bacterium]|jgi:hypothetical protein|nr:hypothetical protein [Pirellulales bacterium]